MKAQAAILLLFLCAKYGAGQVTCRVEGKASCVCDTPDGRIDLTSIANKDGAPRFVKSRHT